MEPATHILYVCHDGVVPPLGQSQVVNLLLELHGKRGLRFSLLSFEKATDLSSAAFGATKTKLEAAGIPWTVLRYRRRPTGLATIWSVMEGALAALQIHRRDPVAIVHARSYVAAAVASLVKSAAGVPFLFDMRGFWADEKLDYGTVTKRSLAYRVAKRAETYLLRHADRIASLSHASVREMKRWPALAGRNDLFEVVTTYANLGLFQPPAARDPSRPFTVGYVGSTHGSYLFDPFVAAFTALRKKAPGARLLVLNRYEQEFLRARLASFGDAVEIKAVEHHEVAAEMGRMDAAIFFIRPTFAKLASAPTKLGELLACGVPCLTNTGVGDVDEILGPSRSGVVVKSFAPAEIEAGVESLLNLTRDLSVRDRCVRMAEEFFSLARGAERYREIYSRMRRAP